jgi:hypothetical protein
VWQRQLIATYAPAGYDDAKRARQRLVSELGPINALAALREEEVLNKTLMLHRLWIPQGAAKIPQ